MVEIRYKKNMIRSDFQHSLPKRETQRNIAEMLFSHKEEKKYEPIKEEKNLKKVEPETKKEKKEKMELSIPTETKEEKKEKEIIFLPEKYEINHIMIWENSISILKSYMEHTSNFVMLNVNEMMDKHLDILKGLTISKDFLEKYLLKNKIESVPAVPIAESIQQDYLICLEDGKKVKMLAPYIKNKFNMSKKDYINKWNLPYNYPFTAPYLSKKRKLMMDTVKPWRTRK